MAPGGTFDPKVEGITTYVGLEHLESERRNIAGAGCSDETLSSKTPFLPGDVLYGKLRPYLSKVALAEAAGVCSTEIIVLRPRDSLVTPEFLYYLCAAPDLRAYAINHSAGTRMPRISPSQLLKAPVSLPPKEEQARFTEILRALDNVIEARRREAESLSQLLSIMADDVVRSAASSAKSRLGDVADVERGYTWKKTEERASPTDGALPVVRIGNVQPEGIDMRDRLWITGVDPKKAASKAITPDTILVVGSNGNPDRVGNAYLAHPSIEGHLYASFLIGIRSKQLPARFVWRYLQSPTIQRQITESTSGSTGLMNISLTWMRDLPVPCPSHEECERLLAPVEAVDRARADALTAIETLRDLKRAALSALLSGRVEVPESYDRFVDGNDENRAVGDLEPATV